MIEKFTVPQTKEEFLEKVNPVTVNGAKAVISGLDVKLKRVAGPMMEEKKFFEEVIAYKTEGKLPERFNHERTK